MGSSYGLLLMQRVFVPTKCEYTKASLTEQGRRSRAFELSNIRSVTCLEPEEVLPLIINLQVAFEQTSF